MPYSDGLQKTSFARLGGKWKLELLYVISDRTVRWRTLVHDLPDAAPNVLTRQLRQLEEDGLIQRQVLEETPPQVVEYKLTPEGKKLLPMLRELAGWRIQYAAGL